MTLEHEPLRKVIRKLQDERDEAVRELERLQNLQQRRNTIYDVLQEFPAAFRAFHKDAVTLWPGITKKQAQDFLLDTLRKASEARTACES